VGLSTESDIDLWTDEALLDPYPLWRELRDTGPVVRLSKFGVWAMPRYKDVREALVNWEVFSSAEGVCLNEQMNEMLRGILLHTDPPEHGVLRRVLRRPLGPHELKELEPEIAAEADALVERLAERGTFDAATELAQHLPLEIVSKRVGLPEDGRENMLEWAAANFNSLGPMNRRTEESLPKVAEAVEYMFDPCLAGRLAPGGWAARLWEAASEGAIPPEKAPVLLADYWAPSLDTTIFATSSAIWLFAQHPDQWQLVRDDPSLIPHAINEIVRLESPIPQFSRVTTRDHDVDGVRLPAGSRVLMMFGSANRDERKWEDPERFDVRRKPTDHLAFGRGEHNCAGQGLARLEIKALLTALARRVERFELRACERAKNNMLRGIARLEVTIHPS
jgi:cytochrome P450